MRHLVYTCASLILCGCTMHASEVGRLQEMGFHQSPRKRLADRKEDPHYMLWVKEPATGARKVQLCVEPQVPVEHYHWRVTVLVDGAARWSYDNLIYGRGNNHLPVDCVASAPLPTGHLTYETSFQYKPYGGSVLEPTPQRAAAPAPLATPSSPPAKPSDPELESRLRTLKELRERNLITEEQYQSSVKELLQKLTQ
jgi:hypothetical protein